MKLKILHLNVERSNHTEAVLNLIKKIKPDVVCLEEAMKKDVENPFGLKDIKGNLRMMSNLMDMAVFPGTQGGPLEHVIAAKAIAFGEILTDEFTTYAHQVKSECPMGKNEGRSRSLCRKK